MSTPAQITAVLTAIAITAAITYHLTRLRAAAHHRGAVAAAVQPAGLTGPHNRAGRFAEAAGVARRPVAVILINFDCHRAFASRLDDRGREAR